MKLKRESSLSSSKQADLGSMLLLPSVGLYPERPHTAWPAVSPVRQTTQCGGEAVRTEESRLHPRSLEAFGSLGGGHSKHRGLVCQASYFVTDI